MTKKEEIINATIDLFAEHGVEKVSAKMVAKKLNVTRSIIYYYFKKGKDEIIDNILKMFDGMITENVKIIMKHADSYIDANSILSSLFITFSEEESERGRKINKIILTNYAYDEKIGKYLLEVFYKKREARFAQVFNMLIESGKVESFDTETAARILNRLFIASALEDTFFYPFEHKELSPCLANLRKDCTVIVNQILSGSF